MSRTVTPELYAKQLSAMRHWLLGRDYLMAADALEYARDLHCGIRKDGVSPEFSHQLFLMSYARTLLPNLIHKEETLTAIALHDVPEDFDVAFSVIRNRYGDVVEDAVNRMTKKHRGVVVPYEVYFPRIAEDPIASVGKGIDRGHNIFTMASARWNLDKQGGYVDDLDDWYFPMLKAARRRFPAQEPVYQNIKTLLYVQAAHARLGIEQGREIETLRGQVNELTNEVDELQNAVANLTSVERAPGGP